jgi:hypothetical protein
MITAERSISAMRRIRSSLTSNIYQEQFSSSLVSCLNIECDLTAAFPKDLQANCGKRCIWLSSSHVTCFFSTDSDIDSIAVVIFSLIIYVHTYKPIYISQYSANSAIVAIIYSYEENLSMLQTAKNFQLALILRRWQRLRPHTLPSSYALVDS